MAIPLKHIALVAFCAVILAVTFWTLALGGVLFCCADQGPGEGLWTSQKFAFRILPICASITLTVYVWRSLARVFLLKRNVWLVGCFLAIAAAIFDLALFVKYRHSVDNSIVVAWEAKSGTFSWGLGTVKVPAGFTYAPDHGMDTLMGHFTSPDGNLVVEHDIGELAGEHGGMGRSETLTEGSRVRLRHSTTPDATGRNHAFVKVSFPDSGCANFYLESPDEDAAATIEFLARTFRPTDWKPAWLRPMLPELLRSDCRYRFRSPFE